jgi:hypothetical protein
VLPKQLRVKCFTYSMTGSKCCTGEPFILKYWLRDVLCYGNGRGSLVLYYPHLTKRLRVKCVICLLPMKP